MKYNNLINAVKNNQKGLFTVLLWVTALLGLTGMVLKGLRINIFADDAYYYMQTAINRVNLGFFTFDTVNQTNGFHPLWQWIQAIVLAILPEVCRTPSVAYVIIIVLLMTICFSILAFSVYLFRKFYSEDNPLAWAFISIAIILFSSKYVFILIDGMESTLALIFGVFFIYSLYNEKEIKSGIFAALCVASRLDSLLVFIFPVLGIYYLSKIIRGQRNIKSCAILALKLAVPTIIFLGGYLTYNYIQFGHIKPISGALKNSMPHVNYQPYLLACNRLYLTFFLAFLGFGIWLFKARKQNNHRINYLIPGLFLSFLMIMTNFLFFQKWSKHLPPWYYIVPTFVSMVIVFLAIYSVLQQTKRKYCLAALVIGTLGLNILFAGRMYTSWSNSDKNPCVLPEFYSVCGENSIMGSTDCGRMGFLGRKCVNLDGLINNYKYQHYLNKKNGFAWYLIDQNIDFLVTGIRSKKELCSRKTVYEPMYKAKVSPMVFHNREYKNYKFYTYSYLYNKYSDSITLDSSMEVYRGPAKKDGKGFCREVVFDLRNWRKKFLANHRREGTPEAYGKK